MRRVIKNFKTIKRISILSMVTLVGSFCAYYLIFVFPWYDALVLLGQTDWMLLITGGILTILTVWVCRAVRFYVLALANGAPIKFIDAYLFTALSLALNSMLAFQLGEVLKMKALKERSELSVGKLARLFFAERLIDVSMLAILTLFTVHVLFPGTIISLLLSILGFMGFLVYLGLCFWPQKENFFIKLIFAGANSPLHRFLVFITTLGSWIGTAWLWQISFSSVFIDLDFNQTMYITGMSTFAGVLSAIPGGIGISEVSISFLLTQASIPSAHAHAGALVIRLITILILMLGFLHLFIWLFRTHLAKQGSGTA